MNDTTLDLIDRAIAAAKHAAHSCHNDTAREHFEFAMALLRETWIAESGQEARSPAQVIADVNWAMKLFASITPEPSLPPIAHKPLRQQHPPEPSLRITPNK